MQNFLRIALRLAVMLTSLGLSYIVGMQSFTICVEGSQLQDMGFYYTGLVGLLITPLFLISVIYSFRNPVVSAKAVAAAGISCLIVGSSTNFKSLILWGGVSLAVALTGFLGSRLRKKVKLRVIPGGKLKNRQVANNI